MKTALLLLSQRVKKMKWPTLAKSIGDFALYESLLMGFVNQIEQDGEVEKSKVPGPDPQTLRYVNSLRSRNDLDTDEISFLDYFDLLEEIRVCILKES